LLTWSRISAEFRHSDSQCPLLAHRSRGNCREGRPVTARKRTLALSRSLAARARARIAELEQEIERLQRTEEAIVVATGAPRERGCPAWVVLVISPGLRW
jgi:hypothetical protein